MTEEEDRRSQFRLFGYMFGAFALIGLGIWATTKSSLPDTKPSADGVEVPVEPWQMPGYKRGIQAKIWVDPETKCHYLVTGGTWAWNLVPRYDADGASLICNQPVPKEAQ